jgi:hypothetical protein
VRQRETDRERESETERDKERKKEREFVFWGRDSKERLKTPTGIKYLQNMLSENRRALTTCGGFPDGRFGTVFESSRARLPSSSAKPLP